MKTALHMMHPRRCHLRSSEQGEEAMRLPAITSNIRCGSKEGPKEVAAAEAKVCGSWAHDHKVPSRLAASSTTVKLKMKEIKISSYDKRPDYRFADLCACCICNACRSCFEDENKGAQRPAETDEVSLKILHWGTAAIEDPAHADTDTALFVFQGFSQIAVAGQLCLGDEAAGIGSS
ncbi:hypothetical protein Hypma_014937 [Hypsizygus marmoreus]|uniref:Uncharacterized protein n=1 Tax=Hypsizygus marmoreus TaxID=39966 RepID=A0A369K6B0_HYPMA|nr:hypothetical protein Hypma_014937 [Hypsizygus marmoreus]